MVIQRTCAVTASVSFCARVCVGCRHRRSSPRSTDPRQRVAHQLVHHPLAAEARLHQHHPGRLGPHLADLGRALAARAPSAAPPAPRRRPPARRRRRACPRWPRTSGRSRGSRTRRPPPGRPAPPPRARASPRCDARASSFSTEATPPRVASRMQRSDGPASSSSASTTGHSERVSDSIAASSSNSPRASMIAVPCSPIVPGQQDAVARADRVGGQAGARVAAARRRSCRRTSRRRAPRSTTLVSPATISTPAAAAARGDRLDLGAAARRRPGPPRGSATGVSASGRAPETARSLTVPLTARSPIEPPGKRSGLTTNESVVIASSAPSTLDRAGVAHRLERVAAERRHEQALDHALGRLAAGAVGHGDRARRGTSRACRARSR